MRQQRLAYCALLLLIVLIPNKSGGNLDPEYKNNTIQLCCPHGHRFSLKQEMCFVDHVNFTFPSIHETDKRLDEVFDLVVRRPCNDGTSHFMINPVDFPDSAYNFLGDASVYFPRYNSFISSTKYCLATVNQERLDLIICMKKAEISPKYVSVAILVSLPFLFITFVVYSVLPEFRNMHGYTLRAYIASLLISNTMAAASLQIKVDTNDYSFCAPLSFIFHFAMYSTFLWLNVTCFDIWRTFGGLLPVHNRTTRSDRVSKTFGIYSLYAWGISFLATILIIIMNFVPDIPDYLIKPQICQAGFWFGSRKAKILYFYVPIGFSLICNICLFIWTALKIECDKKRIDHQMRGSESRRHDDRNKERFWMYLKLFIVMGLIWILELGTWLFHHQPFYLWFVADLISSLQGVIIFIIFICKKKVVRLMMKQFGWNDKIISFCWFQLGRDKRSDSQTTTSTTNTTQSTEEIQEIHETDTNVQPNIPAKSSSRFGH